MASTLNPPQLPSSGDTPSSSEDSASNGERTVTTSTDGLVTFATTSSSELVASSSVVVASTTSTEGSAPGAESFTCFPKLPAEIQDMIWNEALTGISVLRLKKGWSARSPIHKPLFRSSGFDPLPIALSCKAASVRWRKLYTFHMVTGVPHYPVLGLRLNLDWTVLYGDTPDSLVTFSLLVSGLEELCRRKDGFRARHIAFHDTWAGMTTGDVKALTPELRTTVMGRILARSTRVETAIAIKRKPGGRRETIIDEVARMIQDSEYRGQCSRTHGYCDTCQAARLNCWRLDTSEYLPPKALAYYDLQQSLSYHKALLG